MNFGNLTHGSDEQWDEKESFEAESLALIWWLRLLSQLESVNRLSEYDLECSGKHY